MNYDQIIRELKKLNLEVEELAHGGSKGINVSFNRKNSKIIGSITHEYKGGYTGGTSFHSNIYREVEGGRGRMNIQPNNQTEFFNIIKELKTTNIPFKQIANRKMIKEAEKTIEKLTSQFKDVRFRLGERKLWLKYLKGKIDSKEKKEALRKLVIKRDIK